MESIRCRCGKIVCQVENLLAPPQVETAPRALLGPVAAILCRHCKRYVLLQIPTIQAIYSTSEVAAAQAAVFQPQLVNSITSSGPEVSRP